MMIHEITEQVGKYKARKRVGRGRASGVGKTSGRGHKGAGQRAGFKRRAFHEGGQMSFARRIPKRGFNNAQFETVYHIVNLKSLEARFDAGAEVDAQALVDAGLIRDTSRPLKVLGEGDLTKKLTVKAEKFSASARKKIEDAGGSISEIAQKVWKRTEAMGKGGGKKKVTKKSPQAAQAKPAKSEPKKKTKKKSASESK